MATSGNKSVSVTSWNTLKFSWWFNSGDQSTANNTTLVRWKLELIAGSDGRIDSTASKDWSVTVNGTKYSGTNTIGISNNSTKTLASGTTVVKHDDDGSKTFSFSFSQEFNITFSGSAIGTISGSGSGTLNTIARASQPSCITWPDHTQDVGYFGDEISIHMNRKSSDFTHTVRYAFGSQTGTIGTGVGTGTTWVIPLSLMNLIPNASKGSGTIYVDTYNGSTLVGTKSCGFTATVPDSVKPSCSFVLEDITGIDDIYGSPVKGLSKIKITVNATLAYSSPIISCTITANGSKWSAMEATTGVLKSSGSQTVSATIKDGRGRTASISYDMAVQDYSSPSISELTVQRCNEDGTANSKGEFVQAIFTAAVAAMNNLNSASYAMRYKKSTASAFTEVSLDDLDDVYSAIDQFIIFPADKASSYDVEITVSDNHGTAIRTTSASTAFATMHWSEDGESIGLLKMAERAGAVDVGGDIFLNGHGLYGSHALFDTREVNEAPEWYMENHGQGTIWEFKKLTAIGFTAPSSVFAPVQTIVPWADSSGGLPLQVAYEGRTRWTRIATSETTWGAWQSEALIAYPVGSIYIAYNHTDPGTLFGGTWQRLTGGFLWASQAGDTIGQTGGEKTVTLTVNQIPAHNHGGTYTNAGTSRTHAWLPSDGSAMGFDMVSAGGGEAHNNMPPYIQVSIWRRTA